MLADRDVVNVPRSASERRRCRCPRGACVLRARAVRGAGGSRVPCRCRRPCGAFVRSTGPSWTPVECGRGVVTGASVCSVHFIFSIDSK